MAKNRDTFHLSYFMFNVPERKIVENGFGLKCQINYLQCFPSSVNDALYHNSDHILQYTNILFHRSHQRNHNLDTWTLQNLYKLLVHTRRLQCTETDDKITPNQLSFLFGLLLCSL